MERPAVKQCTDEENPQFGSVAVQQGPDRWGVMHPEHGGHWANTAEVQNWTEVS